ncbi:hypothetical protein BOTNAR_0138g00070 [Botryotinia narcissicola]|uniref:Uncharacterized protein n=1 Tax=Botryotinia narcissicola TaxID=278944 RepID=A0A4Z1INQ6_9HELO|nr:hypothetical protein BOTNAR_0138g00070 [Botryotinia narcissicola]
MPSPFIRMRLSSVVDGTCIKLLQCIYSEFLASVDYENLDNMHTYMEKVLAPTICIVTVNVSLSETSVWIPTDSKLDLDIRAAAESLGD